MNAAQKYEMDYEAPVPTYDEEEVPEERREHPLGDVYDVYGMASNVHSRKTDMTRDYTLAKYNSELINGKFPKFIREQRKVIRILKSYMLVPKEVLIKRGFHPGYIERALRAMKKSYADCEALLLGELDEMVIISRAGKGEVIKAMLMHGKTREEQNEYNLAVEQGETLKDGLTERGQK